MQKQTWKENFLHSKIVSDAAINMTVILMIESQTTEHLSYDILKKHLILKGRHMSKQRQRRHSLELRNKIIEVAQRIILEEGVEAISIRRVAHELDYSAPIIYHYFRDKTQLLSCAIQEAYRNMLASVKPPEPGLAPDEELRASFKSFIDSAMQTPYVYKAFLLNTSSELLAESSILGACGKETSPTLAKIMTSLEEGISMGLFAPCDVQLTAKVWWSAIFGLFFRLVVEEGIRPAEREALVERQLDILLQGIR